MQSEVTAGSLCALHSFASHTDCQPYSLGITVLLCHKLFHWLCLNAAHPSWDLQRPQLRCANGTGLSLRDWTLTGLLGSFQTLHIHLEPWHLLISSFMSSACLPSGCSVQVGTGHAFVAATQSLKNGHLKTCWNWKQERKTLVKLMSFGVLVCWSHPNSFFSVV